MKTCDMHGITVDTRRRCSMDSQRKRVGRTGATGYIAGQLLPELRDRYDLRLAAVRERMRDGDVVSDVEIVDVLNDEPAERGRWFEGVDTVIHTGYIRADPDT